MPAELTKRNGNVGTLFLGPDNNMDTVQSCAEQSEKLRQLKRK